MSFDPTAIDSLEGLQAKRNKEADDAQIDAKIAAEGIDYDGARDALGGMGEIDPETGKQMAQEALGEEARNEGEPDIDFSVFDDPTGKDDKPQEIINNDIGEQVEEGELPQLGLNCEYAPLLNQFQNEGKLTPKQAVELSGKGMNSENFHEIIQVCDLTIEQETQLTASLEYISSDNTTAQAEVEIQDAFPDIFSDFKNPDLEAISPSALESYREVAEHYIPNAENHGEQEANLDLAIQMAAGDIANKGVLNLNSGNRITFDTAMKSITDKETPITEKFSALQEITEIVGADQAKKGGGKKQIDAFRKKQQEGVRAAEADNAFYTAQAKTTTNNTNNNAHPEDTQPSIDSEKPSGGDIYAAGKIDLANTGNESGLETA